jgi:hypothetical protein
MVPSTVKTTQEFKGQYPDENSVEFDEFDENNEFGDFVEHNDDEFYDFY